MRERVKKDFVPYYKWVNQGLITTTPGNAIDYRFILKEILDLRDRYEILQIGFDPWNALQTATELTDMGIECVEVLQGYKTMTPAMIDLEALLKSQRLNHGNNEVLRWNFGNVQVKTNEYGNIRPVKDKAGERIDGVMAMIIGLVRALNAEDSTSVYEERGVISF
jgi:phage terminase large subunit-like protein